MKPEGKLNHWSMHCLASIIMLGCVAGIGWSLWYVWVTVSKILSVVLALIGMAIVAWTRNEDYKEFLLYQESIKFDERHGIKHIELPPDIEKYRPDGSVWKEGELEAQEQRNIERLAKWKQEQK